MATIKVSIDGKPLRFACEEGDEARLLDLTQKFGAYIEQLRAAHGEMDDYRLSIMAGLMVLDEMNELKLRLARAEDANKELIAAHGLALRAAEENEAAMAQRVDDIAQRIIAAAGKIAPKSSAAKGE